MLITPNRAVIMKCLSEPNPDCGYTPPYSASDVHYMLKYQFEWYGAKGPVSIAQINRTLRDLLEAGLVTKTSQIDPPLDTGLPQRVNYWQLASEVERNKLLTEVREVYNKAQQVHGTFFLSDDHYFDKPYTPEQTAVVMGEIKSLMQRIHPDKAEGFADEFAELRKALAYCKSDINLLETPDKKLKSFS